MIGPELQVSPSLNGRAGMSSGVLGLSSEPKLVAWAQTRDIPERKHAANCVTPIYSVYLL